MKRYTLQDGTILTGDSSFDIVMALRNQSRATDGSNITDFMTKVADEQAASIGKAIRHNAPEDFIEDLLEVGYLTPVAE